MNPVVHFELPAENKKRMMKFYEKAFGWKTNMLGEDMKGYVLVTTTETDEKNMVKTPGTINGGIYQKEEGMSQCPSVVIMVEDLKKSMKIVENAGGKILKGPDEVPKIGSFASFKDTEGNILSMMQSYNMQMM